MSGWQEAVGKLARERELAESGAGLLRRYATGEALRRGQELYAQAKAASDSLIEQLLVAVRAGDDPAKQPGPRTAIAEAVERRVAFSRHVDAQLGKVEGARDGIGDIVGGAVSGVVTGLIEGLVTIWKTWREGRDLQRQAIVTRIEAQRWRAFVDVRSAL